jgi:hypothetical protein
VDYIELPKPDKRFKVGNIKKDKKGQYRGNPTTVQLQRLEPLLGELNKHVDQYHELLKLQLNPPIIIGPELASHLAKPTN